MVARPLNLLCHRPELKQLRRFLQLLPREVPLDDRHRIQKLVSLQWKVQAAMKILSWTLLLLALVTRNSLADIRVVDAYIDENECQTATGIVAAPPPAPSPISNETEKLQFDSLTPVQIPIQCPKGFQAGDQTYTSTGGSCQFQAAPGAVGAIAAEATAPANLVFSCKKSDLSECGGAASSCQAEARVQCIPIPLTPHPKDQDSCRLPGTYGQISALSTGLVVAKAIQRMTDTMDRLKGSIPLPTTPPLETETGEPAIQTQPGQETFRGRSSPGTSSAR